MVFLGAFTGHYVNRMLLVLIVVSKDCVYEQF